MTTETYIDAACIGKMPITIAKFQVQECAHPVYGQGGCTATRAEPCDHVYGSCPSKCDFLCENVDYVHTDCKTGQVGNSYEPDIESVDYGLGSVEFCKGLPQSGTISITFSDSPGCDYGDRYRNTRPSGPDDDGYRLARFDSRHKLEGRLVEVGTGYCEQKYPETFFNARYFTDTFTGPSGAKCLWTLKAKDALSLLSDSASQYPSVDSVTNISSDFHPNDFIIKLADNNGLEIGTISRICVNNEVMAVKYVGVTPTLFTAVEHVYEIAERAVCGSIEIENKVEAGAEATFAAYWPKGTNVAQVYLDLLIKGGGLPFEDQDCPCGPYSSCIVDIGSFTEWAATCGKAYVIPETVICKPTGLRTLFDELAVFGVIPYLDDCDQKIKLHQYWPDWCDPEQDLPTFYETDIVNCRVDVTPKPAERYTSVSIKGSPADCTKGIDDNNLIVVGRMQGIAGTGDVCGNPNWLPRKDRPIKTRFIGGCNQYMGNRLAQRIWYARRDKVRQIRFTVPASRLPVGLRKTSFFMVRHKKLETKRIPPAVYWLTRMRPTKDNCWEITAMTSGFDADQRWRAKIRTCEGECAATISVPNPCDINTDANCALVY